MKKFGLLMGVLALMFNFGYFMKYKAIEGWSGWTILHFVCALIAAIIVGIEVATLPDEW